MSFEHNGQEAFGGRVGRFVLPKYRPLSLGGMAKPAAVHARDFITDRWLEQWHLPLSALGIGLDAVTAEMAAYKSPQKLLSLGVLSPDQLDRICADQTKTEFLIQDFLPVKSIAIAGGESTIGKSALICQLALCVASGHPFFGMRTQQGRVLYFDLENSLLDCQAMRDALVTFLGLGNPPREFLLVPEPPERIETLLEELRPTLVVIDSLRAFRPDVTEKNRGAGEWLKEIRKLSRKHECTFLIVHHLRKPGRDTPSPDLESCNAVTWLQEMEGARALVNQTDVRIAIAEGDQNPAALKIKWARRVKGDSPVVLVERMFSEDGEPIGYQQLTGARLLTKEKHEVYDALPEVFSTGEAKAVRRERKLGDGNDPTNKFLAECRHLRIVENLGRGRWRKLAA